MRTPLVVGNWKMNGSLSDNLSLLQKLTSQWQAAAVEMAVCPPAVYLAQAQALLAGTSIQLGAQDASQHSSGAYTGECSVAMLQEFGCQFVIIGHSERRQYHAESDQLVAEKCLAIKASGLTPIVCVGESLAEREGGATLAVIQRQVQAVLDHVGSEQLAGVVIAYEPIWAIGTGLTASPEQAQEVHAAIRQQLQALGASTRILYGGSVKAGNAKELFAMADIDGALVGGASLIAEDFLAIGTAAAQ
ncbi:triose-phosphate isomerase [Halioxenophilus sp. WMMB6]|uniref:triose-phosphate isomerase n=1 Tax=Halioxenophilus sp. WMMB6 TaxID=3073815 RepID=UPI00295EF718|nr:triose-phosphate isomerase [Halioxenophilus sp. WMMB6]